MSLVFRGIGRERQGEGMEKSEEEQGGMNHVREFWSPSSKEFERGWRKGREWISANKITDSRTREEMQTIIFLVVEISQINFFFYSSTDQSIRIFIFFTFIFISLC